MIPSYERYSLKSSKNIGVLLTKDVGAGWSSWIKDPDLARQLATDARLVKSVFNLEHIYGGFEDVVKEVVAWSSEKPCLLGIKNLEIQWVPPESSFIIKESRGVERISFVDKTRLISV